MLLNQNWAFAHTVRCALRLIYSELRTLRCAFAKQVAFLQFAL